MLANTAAGRPEIDTQDAFPAKDRSHVGHHLPPQQSMQGRIGDARLLCRTPEAAAVKCPGEAPAELGSKPCEPHVPDVRLRALLRIHLARPPPVEAGTSPTQLGTTSPSWTHVRARPHNPPNSSHPRQADPDVPPFRTLAPNRLDRSCTAHSGQPASRLRWRCF